MKRRRPGGVKYSKAEFELVRALRDASPPLGFAEIGRRLKLNEKTVRHIYFFFLDWPQGERGEICGVTISSVRRAQVMKQASATGGDIEGVTGVASATMTRAMRRLAEQDARTDKAPFDGLGLARALVAGKIDPDHFYKALRHAPGCGGRS